MKIQSGSIDNELKQDEELSTPVRFIETYENTTLSPIAIESPLTESTTEKKPAIQEDVSTHNIPNLLPTENISQIKTNLQKNETKVKINAQQYKIKINDTNKYAIPIDEENVVQVFQKY